MPRNLRGPRRSLGIVAKALLPVPEVQSTGKSASATPSKSDAHAKLCGEWDSHRCAGPEEISQRTGGNEKLFAIGDGSRLGAGRVLAERRGIEKTVNGSREGRDVGDVVGAGIVPVEEIEEFDEGHDHPALS